MIVAHAAFLPSANCFALVPLTPLLGRTGSESVGCTLDYNTESQTVELRTVQATRCVPVCVYCVASHCYMCFALSSWPSVGKCEAFAAPTAYRCS